MNNNKRLEYLYEILFLFVILSFEYIFFSYYIPNKLNRYLLASTIISIIFINFYKSNKSPSFDNTLIYKNKITLILFFIIFIMI